MAGSPMKDAEFDMVDDNLRTSLVLPRTTDPWAEFGPLKGMHEALM